MKSVEINIARTPEQALNTVQDMVEFLKSVHGKDAFLRRAGEDFLRKITLNETSEHSSNFK